MTLFPEGFSSALARLKVSPDEIKRWHSRGWLSFSAMAECDLQPFQVDEIEFVRDIMRSGLPDAFIEHLLSQLPRPLSFDPKRIAYSFSLGWVLGIVPPESEQVIEQNLEKWLKGLAFEGNVKRLAEVARRATQLIEDSVS